MPNVNAFEILDGEYDRGLVLLADHATARVPESYGNLGLDPSVFTRHIAYDIGVEMLTRKLAETLSCPAVMSTFSRLLIDPNRGEDDPTLVMKISDGAIIPANHPLSEEERHYRLDHFHRPYHTAVGGVLERVARQSGRVPLVLSIHSFTHAWKGVARPWHAGVLWDGDPRIARPLIDRLAAIEGVVVGDNEPYDGALKGDTMNRHCMETGIPHALLEVRQDLIGDEAGVNLWAKRLAPIFADLNDDPALHVIRRYPSRT
ncbi:N-formylglutamate amidohydrolase [Martelella endophytica]|uniref:N-formylglutamate amidohydrolase n=1 Tax=Martelella endophytica TaxID=1486262 RepID=A0A0D5LQ35_MAREN|nr:N-formylglutamate amidohydrolase [Martelella endophytica]AJY46344.1 N-formylglutamate amidohydrolase [Martelella endophytica]